MAIAEKAQLEVLLSLSDKLSPGLGKADQKLNQFNTTAGKTGAKLTGASRGMAGLARATTGFGTAMGRAGGTLKSFVGGAAGLVGLTLGVAGVTKIFTDSIGAAGEFGAASADFARLTGLDIASASQFVDVLDKYGLKGDAAARTIGFLEKNSQKLAGTTKQAAKFQKDYGFSLTDTNGKVADANTLLLRSADFFNSNATASQKATVLSKLYGKSWQDLIPLLSKGRKAIQDEFATALKLTPKQIQDTQDLRNAQRELNDTWGDTKTLIGLALIPTITQASKALNSFITDNQTDIIGFFQGAAKFAGELGGAIKTTVLPAIRGIAGAWNSIPPEFRQILIGGFVANKVLKMTIGFDPLDIARKSVTDSIGKLVGGFFGRGSPGNPMFTKEVGLPGAVGGAAAAAGPGALATALGVGSTAAALGVIAVAVAGAIGQNLPVFDLVQKLQREADAARGKKAAGPGLFQALHPPAPFTGAGAAQTITAPLVAKLNILHADFQANIAAIHSGTDAQKAAAAQRTAKNIVGGVGNIKTTNDTIAALEKAKLSVTDPAAIKVFDKAIADVRSKLPGREWIAAQERSAEKIVASNRSSADKIRDLGVIQKALAARGDTVAAGIIAAAINSLKPHIDAIRLGFTFPGTSTSQGRGTGKDGRPVVVKDPRVGIEKNREGMVSVKVNVATDHRQNSSAASHQLRYGPTPATAGAH